MGAFELLTGSNGNSGNTCSGIDGTHRAIVVQADFHVTCASTSLIDAADYFDSTRACSGCRDTGGRAEDTFNVIGGVRRGHHVDPVCNRSLKGHVVNQLEGGSGGVQDVGAGKRALKVAGTGNVMRAVCGRNEVVDVAVTERVVVGGSAVEHVVNKQISGAAGFSATDADGFSGCSASQCP